LNVRRAEWHLAQSLAALGAVVKGVRLPPGPPDLHGQPGKVGIDDFLVPHTAAQFRALLETATAPQRPPEMES
jgi:hypothetical protein